MKIHFICEHFCNRVKFGLPVPYLYFVLKIIETKSVIPSFQASLVVFFALFILKRFQMALYISPDERESCCEMGGSREKAL